MHERSIAWVYTYEATRLLQTCVLPYCFFGLRAVFSVLMAVAAFFLPIHVEPETALQQYQ